MHELKNNWSQTRHAENRLVPTTCPTSCKGSKGQDIELQCDLGLFIRDIQGER